MYTYVERPGCKKENMAMYVCIRPGSQTPTRAYVRPGLVYMVGSERRNSVVVVFMGRQRNASYSWGGNGMRRVHGEATECVVFIERQRNAWEPTGWVGTECVVCSLGGPGRNRRWKRGLAYRRTEETALCSTGHVRNGILFIRRGLVYRKTDETDLLRSKRGSC